MQFQGLAAAQEMYQHPIVKGGIPVGRLGTGTRQGRVEFSFADGQDCQLPSCRISVQNRYSGAVDIEWMPGRAVLISDQAVEWFFGEIPDLCESIFGAVISPCRNNQAGLPAAASQGPVVSGPHRIGCLKKNSGIRGTKGERVEHQETVKSPALSKTDTSSNRGIILVGIGSGRVEPDKGHGGAAAPGSGQGIAVSTTSRQLG